MLVPVSRCCSHYVLGRRILILDFRFDFPDYRDDIVREIINSDYRMLGSKGYFFTRFIKEIDS